MAYLSGMRDGELMELDRDCAVTSVNSVGRTVCKIRGRVFKGRKPSGGEAEWVVLDKYKHAKITMFEGYVGTSSSRFAAEVASEEAVAMLGHVEDLYRDWNDGTRSGGLASKHINAEFDRPRAELGDLPGVVSDATRLRTMLRHLTKTAGRPLPRHNMCLRCPNARRSTVHPPRRPPPCRHRSPGPAR